MNPTGLAFLFVSLLFTLYLSTSNSCEIYKFVPSQNQTLQGHVIKTVLHSLVELCWRDCVWLSWCMSINVRSTTHGTVECDLNNSSKRANPGSLVPRQGSQYHEMGAVDDKYCRMYECKRKEDLGDRWFRYGKAAIKLFQQMKNWTDARIFCQSLGGDLLSITNSQENDFVYDVFVKGLNLTYGEREKKFPDVYWKFNGYEPGVRFGGTSGGVRYQSDEGENSLYFSGDGGFADVPAVSLDLKGFTIALWLKHQNTTAEYPNPFTGVSSHAKLRIYINSYGAVGCRAEIVSTSQIESPSVKSCPKNAWCHFAFTWNKTQSLYRIVLNGSKDTTKYDSNLELKTVTVLTSRFGLFTPQKSANFFHGSIKHFMLFNKSLSIHEMQTAMYWHEQGVWIGLNDQANTNTLQWSDGTPVSYFRPLPEYNPQQKSKLEIINRRPFSIATNPAKYIEIWMTSTPRNSPPEIVNSSIRNVNIILAVYILLPVLSKTKTPLRLIFSFLFIPG